MTLANYSELETSIAGYLGRSDRGAQIQNWVRLVELEVQRVAGLRSQQLVVSGTLAAGATIIETPAGMLTPKMLVFDGQPPIVVDVVTLPTAIDASWAEQGRATPTNAVVWGVTASYATQIRVAPTPSASAPYTLFCETGIAPLTAAAPTNYLTFVAPDLYLLGCLVHGHLYDENTEGAAVWRPQFDAQLRAVKRIEALARAKGGRLRLRPQFATP